MWVYKYWTIALIHSVAYFPHLSINKRPKLSERCFRAIYINATRKPTLRQPQNSNKLRRGQTLPALFFSAHAKQAKDHQSKHARLWQFPSQRRQRNAFFNIPDMIKIPVFKSRLAFQLIVSFSGGKGIFQPKSSGVEIAICNSQSFH